MPREMACRVCRTLTTEKSCPNCGSTDLTDNWSGLVIVLDPSASNVARLMGVTKPGRYAIEVH
ncbi:MAG: transcription elongation factor subunit Spt4 [Conexivisphaera sp.]